MDQEISSKHLATYVHDNNNNALPTSLPTFASNLDTSCGNSTEVTTTRSGVLANSDGGLNITTLPGQLSIVQPVLNTNIPHGLADPCDEAETRDFLRRMFSPGIPLISLNGRSLPIGLWLNDPQGVLTESLGTLEQRYRDEPNLSPAELEQDLQAMGIIGTTDNVLTVDNATPQELEAIQGLLKLATDPNGAHVGQDVGGPTESDCEDGEPIGECEDHKDDNYVESPVKKGKEVKAKN